MVAGALVDVVKKAVDITGMTTCRWRTGRYCSLTIAPGTFPDSSANTSGWTFSSGLPRRSRRSISRIRSRNIAAFSYSRASDASAICFLSWRSIVERFDRRNLTRSWIIFLYSRLSILLPHGAVHCFMLYKRHGRKNLRLLSSSMMFRLHVRNLKIFCKTTRTARKSFALAKGPNNLLPL